MYLIKCDICEKEFESRIPHQKTCSKECRELLQKKKYEKRYYKDGKERVENCIGCGKKIESDVAQKRYCSEKCKKHFQYLRIEDIEKICLVCGKSFKTKKKETFLCSIGCINTYTKKHDDIIKICESCGKEFITTYIRREKRFCNYKCANTGEFNSMYGMTGSLSPTYGRESWTKGKTIETDERLKELGRKISITSQKQFKDGVRSNKKENNPMYGKNHSSDSKEKISKTRCDKWVNGEYNNIWKKGTFYSLKNNKEFVFRSSWEEKIMGMLEIDDNVVKYDYEPFHIEHVFQGVTKHYIPDFLIEYKDGIKKLVEIKPFCYVEHDINLSKFSAARKYCESNNLIFEVWTEKEINF